MTCGPADPAVNLLLFGQDDRVGEDKISLNGPRLHHLQQVLGAGIGDTLRVGEIDGLIGEGEVLEISDSGAVLAIALNQPPPDKLPLSLVLALPRPKVLRRILRNVAEFGVAEVHLINSFRVEKSYWQSPALAPATMQRYLLQGLAQSRDTRLPAVHCHRHFKPFVEDILPGMLHGKQALVAHPGAHSDCPRSVGEDMLLVIGPEGGFIPYEVEKLQAAGCTAVALGPRILRVENATTWLLGRLF